MLEKTGSVVWLVVTRRVLVVYAGARTAEGAHADALRVVPAARRLAGAARLHGYAPPKPSQSPPLHPTPRARGQQDPPAACGLPGIPILIARPAPPCRYYSFLPF